MSFVSQDQFFDYLRKIMSRFSGYPFISVSKPYSVGNQLRVELIMHHSLPIQDKRGRYKSDTDIFVRELCVTDTEFAGMIMDRQRHYAFGNPFRVQVDSVANSVPNLGTEKVPFKNEDESAEPL